MPFLQPNEYDISYFDGLKANRTHNAGYSKYTRWYRVSDDFLSQGESQGEYYRDLAFYLTKRFSLVGKKVLDLGCAKGFLVKDLRDFGVDAYGIDISEYAINQAENSIKPYLICADVRTYLKNYKEGEFALIFSRWVLDYIPPSDLVSLVIKMNEISNLQIHSVMEDFKPESGFCNQKTIKQWVNDFNFKKGTIFMAKDNFKRIVVK